MDRVLLDIYVFINNGVLKVMGKLMKNFSNSMQMKATALLMGSTYLYHWHQMLTTMKMMRSGSESFCDASNHHSKHCVATWAIFTDIFPQGLRQKCHCYIGKHNILLCFSLFCLFGHIFDAWRGQKHFPLAIAKQFLKCAFWGCDK